MQPQPPDDYVKILLKKEDNDCIIVLAKKESNDYAIILTKNGGNEFYYFIYNLDNNENCTEIMRTLGRFAANPELSFDWYDAAKLSIIIVNQVISVK